MEYTWEGLAFIGAAVLLVGGFVTHVGIGAGPDSTVKSGSITSNGSVPSMTTFNVLDNENFCSDSYFDKCTSKESSHKRTNTQVILQYNYFDTIAKDSGVYYVEPGTEVEYECGENGKYDKGNYHDAYLFTDEEPSFYFELGDYMVEPEGNPRKLSDEGSFEIDFSTPTSMSLACAGWDISGDQWSAAWVVGDFNSKYVVADDSDDDGVYDINDECPNEGDRGFGVTSNGCPIKDSDGDGISDPEDECVDTPGDEWADGCPDADRDGVIDSEDEFPTDAECQKDSDGDSVCDNKDAFPNDPDREKDSDGDGVADSNDDCPSESGLKRFNGCPDSDGDGIPDYKDSCPSEAGKGFGITEDGCPIRDSDGDGVGNNVDVCEGTPESVNVDSQGCAVDSDNDGVPNYKDKCAGTPAETPYGVNSGGCAIQDADADGVSDSADQCPETYGSKTNGCPNVLDQIINLLNLRGLV